MGRGWREKKRRENKRKGKDTLQQIYRSVPGDETSPESIYFCGNSLGLQPKQLGSYIDKELKAWKDLGVEGMLSFYLGVSLSFSSLVHSYFSLLFIYNFSISLRLR